ncbi:MAG: 6-bladed beta-propeller [Candidatus Delongbacteria bacterium]|jgi:hypothetical protein|nr:6-bladed beta-propeller [Candidatus Delongbacteria bacterium]
MKYVKLLAIVFSIALIVNCTKKEDVKTYEQYEENGIRITSNNGTPADTSFSIELKEVGFIDISGEEDLENLISYPKSFDFDEAGNLYILDGEKAKIHKFNNKFERVSIFGGKGQGPGEFVQPSCVIVKNDTLIVPDSRAWKINKLDLDGKFITDKKYLDYQKTPFDIIKFGTGFASDFNGMSADDTGQRFSIKFISLFDSNLNYLKDVYKFKKLYEPDKEIDPGGDGSAYTANKQNLFLSVNSKTEYKIDVFDQSGDKTRIIRKNYARIRNSEESIKWIEEFNKKHGTKHKTEFRNSIFMMYTDKYGRLWVSSTVKKKEEGAHYDIFKDDVFLKRVNIEMEEGYLPIYIGEKIICQNWKDNSLKIYDY